jgi:hypothetical protein
MGKYIVGDKVKVKSVLEVGEDYGGAEFIPEMVKYLGKEATVTELVYDCEEGSYGLDIDKKQDYEFTDDMLE